MKTIKRWVKNKVVQVVVVTLFFSILVGVGIYTLMVEGTREINMDTDDIRELRLQEEIESIKIK